MSTLEERCAAFVQTALAPVKQQPAYDQHVEEQTKRLFEFVKKQVVLEMFKEAQELSVLKVFHDVPTYRELAEAVLECSRIALGCDSETILIGAPVKKHVSLVQRTIAGYREHYEKAVPGNLIRKMLDRWVEGWTLQRASPMFVDLRTTWNGRQDVALAGILARVEVLAQLLGERNPCPVVPSPVDVPTPPTGTA